MNNPVTTKSFADLDQLIDASTTAFQTLIAGIHRSPTGGVNGDGTARVVLTGGTAGIRFLAKLRNAGIDWSRVKVFFGDERNVPVDHADSNEGQARDALLDHVAIPERNIFGYGLNGGSMEEAVSATRRSSASKHPKDLISIYSEWAVKGTLIRYSLTPLLYKKRTLWSSL